MGPNTRSNVMTVQQRSGSDMCDTQCDTVSCGNGVVEQNEQCDLGTGNNGSNTSCPFCAAICGDRNVENEDRAMRPRRPQERKQHRVPELSERSCGDGMIENETETCDDGSNNGKLHDACDSVCKTVKCGNGIVEQGRGVRHRQRRQQHDVQRLDVHVRDLRRRRHERLGGEACDDGINNGTVGDPCDAQCQLVTCGRRRSSRRANNATAARSKAARPARRSTTASGTLKCTGCKSTRARACRCAATATSRAARSAKAGNNVGSATCASLGYDKRHAVVQRLPVQRELLHDPVLRQWVCRRHRAMRWQ